METTKVQFFFPHNLLSVFDPMQVLQQTRQLQYLYYKNNLTLNHTNSIITIENHNSKDHKTLKRTRNSIKSTIKIQQILFLIKLVNNVTVFNSLI